MANGFGLQSPPPPGTLAPSGTFGAPATGGGILDSLAKAASNPLLQAALAGYLGYIGSPRRGGRGAAMENAGLNAFGATPFDRAMLIVEVLVLAIITYEVATDRFHNWKIRRRSKHIHKRYLQGQTLLNAAPDPSASGDAAQIWKETRGTMEYRNRSPIS